jgi:hypothetical protein
LLDIKISRDGHPFDRALPRPVEKSPTRAVGTQDQFEETGESRVELLPP